MNTSYRRFGTALIGGIIMVTGIGIVVAQLPSEDGLAIAREIYAGLLKPFEKEVCRLQCRTTTITWQDNHQVESVADIEYLASSDRMHLISGEYQMYGDTAVSVAVNPEEKTILIVPSSADDMRHRQRKIVEQVRDAFFAEGRAIAWKEIDANDSLGSNRVLMVKPSEKVTRLTMIDTVTIYLNTTDKTLQKVRLSYIDSSNIDAIEMEYRSLERIEPPDEFSLPVLRTFFDKENRLIPEYAGYTIRDMRGHRPRFPQPIR